MFRTTLLTVIIAATMCVLVPAAPAHAGEAKTVGHLRDHCTKVDLAIKRRANLDETFGAGECLGRIRGFVAGVRVFAGNDAPLCLPAALTARQAFNAFMSWAQNNPQRFDEPWARGVAAALEQAYPCTPKK